MSAKRQPAAGAGQEDCAHAAQRLDHAAHRPRAQRGVAGEEAGEAVAGEQAHQQARPGAGIAEVEHVGGLGEAADADAPDAPAAVADALELDAHGAQRAAVASTSSPSSSPSTRLSPTAMPASISERCEIDLSPGSLAAPERAPCGAARNNMRSVNLPDARNRRARHGGGICF